MSTKAPQSNPGKLALIIAAVVLLVGLAVWQVGRSAGGNPDEQTFTPKNMPPPDGAAGSGATEGKGV